MAAPPPSRPATSGSVLGWPDEAREAEPMLRAALPSPPASAASALAGSQREQPAGPAGASPGAADGGHGAGSAAAGRPRRLGRPNLGNGSLKERQGLLKRQAAEKRAYLAEQAARHECQRIVYKHGAASGAAGQHPLVGKRKRRHNVDSAQGSSAAGTGSAVPRGFSDRLFLESLEKAAARGDKHAERKLARLLDAIVNGPPKRARESLSPLSAASGSASSASSSEADGEEAGGGKDGEAETKSPASAGSAARTARGSARGAPPAPLLVPLSVPLAGSVAYRSDSGRKVLAITTTPRSQMSEESASRAGNVSRRWRRAKGAGSGESGSEGSCSEDDNASRAPKTPKNGKRTTLMDVLPLYSDLDLNADDRLMAAAETAGWRMLEKEREARELDAWLALPESVPDPAATEIAVLRLELRVATSFAPGFAEIADAGAGAAPVPWPVPEPSSTHLTWPRGALEWWLSPAAEARRRRFLDFEARIASADEAVAGDVAAEGLPAVKRGDCDSRTRSKRQRWRTFRDWYFGAGAKRSRQTLLAQEADRLARAWASHAAKWKLFQLAQGIRPLAETSETDAEGETEADAGEADAEEESSPRLGGVAVEATGSARSREPESPASPLASAWDPSAVSEEEMIAQARLATAGTTAPATTTAAAAAALPLRWVLASAFVAEPPEVLREYEFETRWGATLHWSSLSTEERRLECKTALCDPHVRQLAMADGVLAPPAGDESDPVARAFSDPETAKPLLMWFAGHVDAREMFLQREITCAAADFAQSKIQLSGDRADADGLRVQLSEVSAGKRASRIALARRGTQSLEQELRELIGNDDECDDYDEEQEQEQGEAGGCDSPGGSDEDPEQHPDCDDDAREPEADFGSEAADESMPPTEWEESSSMSPPPARKRTRKVSALVKKRRMSSEQQGAQLDKEVERLERRSSQLRRLVEVFDANDLLLDARKTESVVAQLDLRLCRRLLDKVSATSKAEEQERERHIYDVVVSEELEIRTKSAKTTQKAARTVDLKQRMHRLESIDAACARAIDELRVRELTERAIVRRVCATERRKFRLRLDAVELLARTSQHMVCSMLRITIDNSISVTRELASQMPLPSHAADAAAAAAAALQHAAEEAARQDDGQEIVLSSGEVVRISVAEWDAPRARAERDRVRGEIVEELRAFLKGHAVDLEDVRDDLERHRELSAQQQRPAAATTLPPVIGPDSGEGDPAGEDEAQNDEGDKEQPDGSDQEQEQPEQPPEQAIGEQGLIPEKADAPHRQSRFQAPALVRRDTERRLSRGGIACSLSGPSGGAKPRSSFSVQPSTIGTLDRGDVDTAHGTFQDFKKRYSADRPTRFQYLERRYSKFQQFSADMRARGEGQQVSGVSVFDAEDRLEAPPISAAVLRRIHLLEIRAMYGDEELRADDELSRAAELAGQSELEAELKRLTAEEIVHLRGRLTTDLRRELRKPVWSSFALSLPDDPFEVGLPPEPEPAPEAPQADAVKPTPDATPEPSPAPEPSPSAVPRLSAVPSHAPLSPVKAVPASPPSLLSPVKALPASPLSAQGPSDAEVALTCDAAEADEFYDGPAGVRDVVVEPRLGLIPAEPGELAQFPVDALSAGGFAQAAEENEDTFDPVAADKAAKDATRKAALAAIAAAAAVVQARAADEKFSFAVDMPASTFSAAALSRFACGSGLDNGDEEWEASQASREAEILAREKQESSRRAELVQMRAEDEAMRRFVVAERRAMLLASAEAALNAEVRLQREEDRQKRNHPLRLCLRQLLALDRREMAEEEADSKARWAAFDAEIRARAAARLREEELRQARLEAEQAAREAAREARLADEREDRRALEREPPVMADEDDRARSVRPYWDAERHHDKRLRWMETIAFARFEPYFAQPREPSLVEEALNSRLSPREPHRSGASFMHALLAGALRTPQQPKLLAPVKDLRRAPDAAELKAAIEDARLRAKRRVKRADLQARESESLARGAQPLRVPLGVRGGRLTQPSATSPDAEELRTRGAALASPRRAAHRKTVSPDQSAVHLPRVRVPGPPPPQTPQGAHWGAWEDAAD